MSTISPDQLAQQLSWRYATKKFDATKKISATDWKALEESLVLSPSSFGLPPWRFVVISDATLRAQLREVSWGQNQITDASHLVVLARKQSVTEKDVDALIDRICKVRGVAPEALAQYRGMMVGFIQNPALDMQAWTARQVYIALGFFLNSAALLGIDACPMEGIDPAAYDKVLGLSEKGYHATVVVTAGYRAADDHYAGLPKVRFEASQVIEHR